MRPLLSRFTSLPRALSALVLALSLAGGLRAGASILDLSTTGVLSPDYCPHVLSGTAVYALSSALSGTSSGPIDLGAVGCFAFCITGTGSAKIDLLQSFNSTTYVAGTTQTAGTIFATCQQGNQYAQRCYAVPKKGGRYVWFYIEPPTASGPYAPLQVTPKASTTTIQYLIPNAWPN